VTGHVYQRDKSRRDVWQLIIELGRDENGKRRWKYESVHGTKGHAKKVLRQRLNELEAGTYVEPTDLTVAEYLRSWHKDHARHYLSARALESNGYTLERHVIPGLGGHEPAKLRAMHLEAYHSAKLDSGLSPSSVRKHHNIIHSALRHAVRLQLLASNPADLVVPPRVTRREMTALDETQTATLVKAGEGTALYLPILLAVSTGMRRGELLGLRWSVVDLEGDTLVVCQTLQEAYGELHFKASKTSKSRRRIDLPTITVEALHRHRAEQARRRLRRAPGWTDSDLVLAAPRGGPWWPSNFDRVWRRFKTKQKLEIRFHDLRHTHATQLLKAGVHPKVVSERLGHASIGVTLDTYSHVMPGMQEEAAEKIDAGLRKALAG
jgi:integrase